MVLENVDMVLDSTDDLAADSFETPDDEGTEICLDSTLVCAFHVWLQSIVSEISTNCANSNLGCLTAFHDSFRVSDPDDIGPQEDIDLDVPIAESTILVPNRAIVLCITYLLF